MIISASRRCDVPNYQSDWFFDAMKQKHVMVPKNQSANVEVPLAEEDVDCIVFWTKNPEPMLNRLQELNGYMYYFQFTLTGYGKKIEPGVPNKKRMLEVFKELSLLTEPRRVIWRYDPIFISQEYTVDYHKRAFAQIAEALDGFTEQCVISFIDIYGKAETRLETLKIRKPSVSEVHELSGFIADTAFTHGIMVETCAERMDLSEFGITHAHCIDGDLISNLIGRELDEQYDPSQRPACGCCKSVDIGAYHTCKNGCAYCYAR